MDYPTSRTCQSCNRLVATLYGKTITNEEVFSLQFDEIIWDNILNYAIKPLQDKLGLIEAPIAFFSSFSSPNYTVMVIKILSWKIDTVTKR
jgi:hypothetical protein